MINTAPSPPGGRAARRFRSGLAPFRHAFPVGRGTAALASLVGLVLTATATTSARGQDIAASVPMRDGTLLATDVYLPTSPGPWPAILMRTPYNKATDPRAIDPEFIQEARSRGYAYVAQDMRGRYASEGADSTFWTDAWGANQDGFDTVEWIATRPWSNGAVGMVGESARGIVQYLAAGAVPPALKACVSTIACDDFYQKAFFQGGAYRESLVEGWFEDQGSEEMLPFFLAHPTHDPFWDALDLRTRASDVTVPILHVGGHYDIFGESAVDAFRYLQSEGGPGAAGRQKLVLGPWTHFGIGETVQGELTYPPHAGFEADSVIWRWYDRWVKGVENGIEDEPAAQVYVMGDPGAPFSAGNEWRFSDTFPQAAWDTPFYLHGPDADKPRTLQSYPPELEYDTAWYENDPADPVSTRGGRNLNIPAGPMDQVPAHAGRTDGVRFQSDAMTVPLTIMGKVRFHFWAEVSTRDIDWCVKLIDRYPDGREMLVTDGVLRARFRNGFEVEEPVTPWTVAEYEVDLWSTAIAFDVGHRIVVTVTNSNYPRFAVNPQDGNPFGWGGPSVQGTVGVYADVLHPSHLVLPITDWALLGTGDVASSAAYRVGAFANPAPRFRVEVLGAPVLDVHDVFDVGGRRVRRLRVDERVGRSIVSWDGRDGAGRRVAPGVYFLALGAGGQLTSHRLVLTD